MLKRIGIVAAGLLTVFLMGYVPGCLSARHARAERDTLALKLLLANLRGELGMISYEANRNNYGTAAQLSPRFFDDVAAAVDRTPDEDGKRHLREVLTHRDEITASLAKANPAVKTTLTQMYADFFQIASTQ